MDREVGIKPVQGRIANRPLPASPILAVVIIRHVSSQESTAPIDLAVVQPVLRLIGLGVADVLDLLRLEVIEIEAVGQRQHGAAFLTERHRANVAAHKIGLHVAAIRLAAPDLGGRAVDPIQPLLLDIPERAFAEMVLAVHQQADVDHGASSSPFLFAHHCGRSLTGIVSQSSEMFNRLSPNRTYPQIQCVARVRV